MTRKLSADELKARRKARQGPRQKKRLPHMVGKRVSEPEIKLKTVHAEDLSVLRMAMGGERKWRIVIDGNKMIEWIGFGWIMIREATAEDRRNYPRVVRG